MISYKVVDISHWTTDKAGLDEESRVEFQIDIVNLRISKSSIVLIK